MDAKMFTVIVGDLVDSRNNLRRQEMYRKICLAIRRLAKKFHDEFYAPIILTRGTDELSGTLKRPDLSYQICRQLNDEIYPQLFRFAIVRGPLDIAIDSKDASKMDGQAFHIAADIIHHAKKKNLCYYFNLGDQFAGFDPWLTIMANTLHILRSGWSNHQRMVIKFIVHHFIGDSGQGYSSVNSGKSTSKGGYEAGAIIGKCENFLIISLILANAFTGLALIFTAKSIVRSEDIKRDPRYYLGGTLVNFSYSVLMGFLIRIILCAIGHPL